MARRFIRRFPPQELAEMSRDRCMQIRVNQATDPWDGRVSKELLNFVNRLKERFPLTAIHDLYSHPG